MKHPESCEGKYIANVHFSHKLKLSVSGQISPNSPSNTFLVVLEPGILVTCPSQSILPAFPTVRMPGLIALQLSKLVVHPSPPSSMLEHTAKDNPQNASLNHAQRILHSDGLKLMSLEDHRANICHISLTFLIFLNLRPWCRS